MRRPITAVGVCGATVMVIRSRASTDSVESAVLISWDRAGSSGPSRGRVCAATTKG